MNSKRAKTISSFLFCITIIGFLVMCFLYLMTKSPNVIFVGVFLCIGFLISGVAVGLFGVRSERRTRTKELEKVSGQLGWKFDPQPENRNFLKGVPEIIDAEFMVSLLDGTTHNLMTGNIQGWDFAVFDQFYIKGDGEDKSETAATLFIVSNSRLHLPVFCCEPKTFIHKFLKFLFKGSVLFETNPEFSRKYHLHGTNEIAVRQTFNPKVLTHFQKKNL